MSVFEKTTKLKDEDFKQIIGVKRETFTEMAGVLTEDYLRRHSNGGRPPSLTIENRLCLALKYWRQYVTQKELAFEFEVGEQTVRDTIVWIEDTLIKSGKFALPGKKVLLDPDNDIEIVLVDVTESPIERPKKNNGNGTRAKRKGIQSKRN
jgi:hypothetical protein